MTRTLARRRKDPNAIRDIPLNWGSWTQPDGKVVSYLPAGVTITGASSSVDPPGALAVVSTTFTTTKTTTRVSGGVDGVLYDVAVHIVMSNGEEDDRSVTVDVRQC